MAPSFFRALISSTTFAFGLVCAFPALAGCSHSSASRSTSAASPYEAAQRSTVPAGATFNASLDAPFSSMAAEPGDRLSARLEAPLRAPDGSVLAPRGAQLVGHVLAVDRVGLGRVAVQFDGLVVGRRVHAIYAQLVRVDGARVEITDVADPDSLRAEITPAMPSTPEPATGGGPMSGALPVELPRGVSMRLVLSRPFALPVANSARDAQGVGEVDRTFE